MYTAAERSRKRVRCRYRHGEVKPLSYFHPSFVEKSKDGPATREEASGG